jgi:hypothetical protein
VLWTGKGLFSIPDEDDARLVDRYGQDTALDLVPLVRQLAREFDESDAAHTVADLKEMDDAAAARFRQLHPEFARKRWKRSPGAAGGAGTDNRCSAESGL